MAAYCVLADVEALTGSLTVGQQAIATTYLTRASDMIDIELGHSFRTSGAQTEDYWWPANVLYLRHWPISSITSITGRAGIGGTETTLTANTEYEIRDAASGLVYLVSPGGYDRVRVVYTPSTTVPASIVQATALTVASWMTSVINPGMAGIVSYQLPDLSVKFGSGGASSAFALPPTVRDMLSPYRNWIVA